MKNVKIAIIGAGTAGLTARREVAKVTDDYLVFEDGPLGTTCARSGCMPSKVLIQIANYFHSRHSFETMGIKIPGGGLTADTAAVMRHMRHLRDRFVRAVMRDLEGWDATHLVRKRVRFLDLDLLEAGSERYKAEKIIVATGSTPIIPEDWTEVRHRLIDTEQFFELEDLPGRMAVIGLGAIGIELGQALARLGVQISAITLDKAFGGLTDPVIQQSVYEALSKEFSIDTSGVVGMQEKESANGQKILEVKSGGNRYDVDAALVAVGRLPQLAGLGLEDLAIERDGKGIPVMENETYRVKGTEIYLAGDVNGTRPVLHEASDEGHIAGFNAVSEEPQCFRRRAKMSITFTDPNIAVVGTSLQEMKEMGRQFVAGAVSYRGQGRAIVKHKETGDLHVYVDAKSAHILGAEIFAPDGEHLAHLLAWAIEAKLTVHEAMAMPYYHPVTEEGLRTALRSAARQLEQKMSPLELMRCSDPPIR